MTKHHFDDLPGYTLGALEAEDRARAELHLAECPDCRSEAVVIAEVLHTALGEGVPPLSPSPLLRTQFLARLALEMGPAATHPVPGLPATPTPPLIVQQGPGAVGAQGAYPRRPQVYWMAGLVALPTALAVVFAVFFFNMKSQLDDMRGHPFSAAIASGHTAMILNGAATRYGAGGELIVPAHTSSGLLIVSGLPAAPSGMAYTCWLRRDGRWESAGNLKPDASGLAMMVFDRSRDLQHADIVGITMEHMDQPTAQPAAPMLLSTRI